MSRRDKVKVITKQFILDQMTENEIDLSMNELTTVPVKELVNFTTVARLNHTLWIDIFRLLFQEEQNWTCLGIT